MRDVPVPTVATSRRDEGGPAAAILPAVEGAPKGSRGSAADEFGVSVRLLNRRRVQTLAALRAAGATS